MTTEQVLFGVGLILVLAVGSQVLASQLRIPALIILLPVGFTAGALTSDVNPQRLLGAAFQPLVSLAVAVILYDAGLGLDLAKLRGHTRRVVFRLIAVGVPVTWAFAAVFAGLLLGMPVQAAVMTGAILVVSGPTVVGPLLRFIRPTERLQRVLLTGEDDFNALAATILAGNDETTVYRLAPRHPSHGVIAPFTGGQTIFAPGLTRDAITLRYDSGARISAQPSDLVIPTGTDPLFLISPDGTLTPLTSPRSPAPVSPGTLVLLEPAPVSD